MVGVEKGRHKLMEGRDARLQHAHLLAQLRGLGHCSACNWSASFGAPLSDGDSAPTASYDGVLVVHTLHRTWDGGGASIGAPVNDGGNPTATHDGLLLLLARLD